MRVRCIGILLGLTLCCAPLGRSEASTEELDMAAVRAIPFGTLYASIEDRRKLATAILAYWENFNGRLPRLSPVEEAWLQTEIGAESERIERAINSKEYALWSIALRVDGCLTNVRAVLRTEDSEVERSSEMLYWNNLTNCYADTDDLNDQLLKAGLSNGRYDGPFHIVGLTMLRSTITNTAVPSAMADTMGWTLSKQ